MEPTSPVLTRRSRARRRGWDWALFASGFLVTTLGLTNVPIAEDDSGVTDQGLVIWLVAFAAWVTVFFRRSHPWLVLGAGLMMAVVGVEYLLFLIGVHHVLVAREHPRRWIVGAAAVLMVVLFWLREAFTAWGGGLVILMESDDGDPIVASAVVALASLGIMFIVTALKNSQRTADRQRARADAEQLHADQLRQELVRQAERSRLARDIHDGLTNRLALLSMIGGNVSRAVRSGDPGAATLADQLQAQSRDALTDLRTLVGDLRTTPAGPPSQPASMRSVGDLIVATQSAGTRVDAVVILDSASEASAMLDAAVFRLTQEALTNAVKHAPSRKVALYLSAQPSAGVRLRVTNALTARDSHDVPRGAGAGLVGMRERVSALDGAIWTGPYQGEFIVDIELPWATTDNQQRAAPLVQDHSPSLGP